MSLTKKLLIALAALLIVFAIIYYDTVSISSTRYITRVENLSSSEIPPDMDDKTILFFSDLEYGTFMDENRLEKVISRINSQSNDVVIFGGDLFDENAKIDESYQDILVNALSSIDAPLGKFAVLGDNDTKDEETLKLVENILFQSGFEILNNRSIHISNYSNESIQLVGLSDGINTELNAEEAYANVSVDAFTITICHTPDSALQVPVDKTDYFLAGHSHGGQVYYLFGSTYSPEKTESFFRGKQSVKDDFTIDITNGIGTTGKDMRFLADAEIVTYKLKSLQQEKTPEETIVPQESSSPETQDTSN